MSGSPSPTWTRPSPSTPRPSACGRCTRRPTRSRASGRPCSPSGRGTPGASCRPRRHRRRTPRTSCAHRAPGDRVNGIRDAILADELSAVGGLAVPEGYRAVLVRRDEQDMFAGLATKDKDPRKSLHVEEVATPQLGPGEALVAVMASSV